MGPKILVLQLRPRINCPVTAALLRGPTILPYTLVRCGYVPIMATKKANVAAGHGQGMSSWCTGRGGSCPFLRTRGRWRGQPGRIWASHQVTTTTLALEVAQEVLLMAHVEKLRHRTLTAPPRVSQCMGPPTPRPHHFRSPMAGQAGCVGLHGLPSYQAILGAAGPWQV